MIYETKRASQRLAFWSPSIFTYTLISLIYVIVGMPPIPSHGGPALDGLISFYSYFLKISGFISMFMSFTIICLYRIWPDIPKPTPKIAALQIALMMLAMRLTGTLDAIHSSL